MSERYQIIIKAGETLEVVVAGKNLIPPSYNNGILTECTKCDWTMLERL